MLGLAQELGIEELWRSCEEHVSVTLSPGNACALLTAALEAQERVPGIYLKICIFSFASEEVISMPHVTYFFASNRVKWRKL